MAQDGVGSYKHYFSVRPLTFLTFNPNIQYGRVLKLDTQRKANRLIEFGLMYPYGKTLYLETFSYTDYTKQISAFQFDARFRFVYKSNKFIGPLFVLEYKKFDELLLPRPLIKKEFMNIMLGFNKGRYFGLKDKNFDSFHWGLALRYCYDFIEPEKKNDFGDYDYYYWGLKFYLNWQVGIRFTKVKPAVLPK